MENNHQQVLYQESYEEPAPLRRISEITPGIPEFLLKMVALLPRGTFVVAHSIHNKTLFFYQQKNPEPELPFSPQTAATLCSTLEHLIQTTQDPTHLFYLRKDATSVAFTLYGAQLSGFYGALQKAIAYQGPLPFAFFPFPDL